MVICWSLSKATAPTQDQLPSSTQITESAARCSTASRPPLTTSAASPRLPALQAWRCADAPFSSPGDAALLGPFPGTELPNPNPSSPILSSVLEVHFSANAEKTASGFTLTDADQLALQSGTELVLDNGKGDKLTIKLLADFPNVVPAPRPDLPDNTVSSNPFGVAVNNNLLYVVDASLNRIWTVELSSGATAILTTFAPLTNPFPLGPPAIDA